MRVLHKCFCWIFLLMPMTATAQTLKVMSYNIRYDNPNDGENRWDRRKQAVVGLVKHYEPLVLGIQEGLHRQVAYLDSSLADYAYFGVGREDGKTKGEYSAVFYHQREVKLIQQATFWLSETSEKPSVGWDAALERICTYGLLEHQATQQRFWVFNTHFDHRGAKARNQSARLIMRKINELNTDDLPVVLMGDFNLLPINKPIRYLKTQLQDGKKITQKAFYGPRGTFNGFRAKPLLLKRIDYVFVRKFKVESYTHIDDRTLENLWISDHLPVFCTLSF